MNILSLVSGVVRLASAFFGWLRDFQIFQAGRTAAERDGANEKLSKLDKVKRFRDRVDTDPRYSGELRRKYGDSNDGLRVPSETPDKPV